MKFKEIKPGMVIHCSTAEEGNALAEHLNKLGYRAPGGGVIRGWSNYIWISDYKRIECMCDETMYSPINRPIYSNGITEFSDLIEPDEESESVKLVKFGEEITKGICDAIKDKENSTGGEKSTEMSAVEVLEWLDKHYGDGEYKEVFGVDFTSAEFLMEEERGLSAQEVVDRITAYEAAKKEQKPVEVEFLLICHVYEWWGDKWEEVRKVEHIIGGGCENEYEIAKQDLLDYRQSPQWRHECYVVSERRCRVKGE